MRVTKFSILTVFAVALSTPSLGAEAEPSAKRSIVNSSAIPVYGKSNPGKPSDEMRTGAGNDVRNVTYPTLTPVLPKPGTANGTAVIVAPGGGFMFLSMDGEGLDVARALADRGITAFVLKYRLQPTPQDDAQFNKAVVDLIVGIATGKRSASDLPVAEAGEDALASLKFVRSHAKDWGIDPSRVGMIGFSAGAITTLRAVVAADKDSDPATLPPDFFGYIYGPMEGVEVPAKAPPMFAALAMNDGMFGKDNFNLVQSWRRARRPVELHVYQDGGHGFGLGKPGMSNAMLMPEFLAWMDMQGLLKPKN